VEIQGSFPRASPIHQGGAVMLSWNMVVCIASAHSFSTQYHEHPVNGEQVALLSQRGRAMLHVRHSVLNFNSK